MRSTTLVLLGGLLLAACGEGSLATLNHNDSGTLNPDDCPDGRHECPAEGARECHGDGWRECGEYDHVDTCLEWSAVEPCTGGLTCDPASVTCQEPCRDSCDPFSIVIVPDTQYYTAREGNTTYRKQMQWILDHRQAERIQAAVHMGDITNNNLPAQWKIADNAHALLDAADMPYSVLPGNHDYLVGTLFDRGKTLFNDYFGQNRFEGRSWYGGALGAGNTNNYIFFEVGALKFLVLSLEYSPRKSVLCEANDLIASHPEHRVIVATHCYLGTNGAYVVGCPHDNKALGTNGRAIWDELVSRHSNIFLVASGHVNESAYVPRQGNAGNTVHQMVVDYQCEMPCSAADPARCTNHCNVSGKQVGNGWLRLLVFDPRANQVRAHTFSAEDGNAAVFPGGQPTFFCSELNTNDQGRYAADPLAQDHDFVFTYGLTSMPPYVRDDLGRQGFLDQTVNTAGGGNQLTPRVARAAGGSFVVVWEDDSSSADGAGNHDILARGFKAGGCQAFADRVINPVTAGQQQSPAIASDAAGNFVVVWADDQDGNGFFQLLARGFTADGSERFAVRTVNASGTGQQLRPAIAMAPDGRFVVAWEDNRSGTFQIRMRGFTADGTERFSDRSVHDDATGQRIRPTLGLDANANLVVAWQDDSDGNGFFEIHARGFTADGTARFPRLTVNSVGAGQQRLPAIGVASSGAFVVAWEDDQDGDGKFQILARSFTSTGAGRLGDFLVSDAAGHHLAPTVASSADGSFLITWQADPDGSGAFRIDARAWRGDGTVWKPKWTVNHITGGQQLAPHAALGDAVVVFAWQDDFDGNGVYQILAHGLDLL